MILKITQEIWNAVAQTYSQTGNAAKVFELVKKEYEMRQGERLLSQYHADLRSFWQEIDYCEPDARRYKLKMDKMRGFSLLARLN